jgi:hypothetical protein
MNLSRSLKSSFLRPFVLQTYFEEKCAADPAVELPLGEVWGRVSDATINGL